MAEHQHVILEGKVKQVDYESSGFPRSIIIDRGEPLVHSNMLREQYIEAIELFSNISLQLPRGVVPVDGSYLDFRFDMTAKSIDKFDSKTGVRLMNVHQTPEGEENHLTVYLPTKHKGWLTSKLTKYNKIPEGNKNRANANLVNSISSVQSASLRSFFMDAEEFDNVQDDAAEYEMWVDKELHDENEVRRSLQIIGVSLCNRHLVFNDVVVYMIIASKEQLLHIIHSVKGITEIRIHKRPTVLTNAGGMREQDEWIDLIKADRIVVDNPCRVAILDSGVANNHPLIEDFLPQERCHSVTINGDTRDLQNHGTGLASLVLYGDLTDVIYQQNRVEVYGDLTSVKMFPGKNEDPNEPEMYALITEDAIVKGRVDNAQILCSAITSDSVSKCGMPSSTSAAIDQALYNNGQCDSLMLISAGNIYNTGGVEYPNYLFINPTLDPSQTWNAITVGAYTRKSGISDSFYRNSQVISPCGGISPFSRTSTQWGKSLIKPEIVMEGGNAILNGKDIDMVGELSLVCADNNIAYRKFTTSNATSAATAMAARLATKIKHFNPSLSPLTIRALLVHSAEWTEKMKELFTDKQILIHTCGYGVPIEKKALASSDSYVTFIAEDTIMPFVKGANGNLKFGHMNLYELPWPKETLLQMGETEVSLKITLSYYICPSPGARGMMRKYTYQSIRLNFDVNGPTEDLPTFENRIKRFREEGEIRDSDLAKRWTIGIQTRNQGSVISDRIEKTTAAQIASCNKIAIYPSGGWLRNYPVNAQLQIKYSLIVSLETPEQIIYDEIAVQLGNAIQVGV